MNLLCTERRVLLLHQFRLDRKATEAARNIRSTINKNTLSISTAQHGFNRFKSDDFELNESRHFGRPVEVDVDV